MCVQHKTFSYQVVILCQVEKLAKEMRHPNGHQSATKTERMVNAIHLSMNSIRIISIRFKVKEKSSKTKRNETKTEWSAFLRFGIPWDNVSIVASFHISFGFVCVWIHRSDLSFVCFVRSSVCLFDCGHFKCPVLPSHCIALYCKCTYAVWIWWLPFISDSFFLLLRHKAP